VLLSREEGFDVKSFHVTLERLRDGELLIHRVVVVVVCFTCDVMSAT